LALASAFALATFASIQVAPAQPRSAGRV